MMTTTLLDPVFWADAHAVAATPQEDSRGRRIQAALGLLGDQPPAVDAETLARYYRYLAERLSFPFSTCYPEPLAFHEYGRFRCTVLELLDPATHRSDPFDGILCRARKGGQEVTLPLTDIDLPPDHPNFQWIDDYSYWFWNWRI